MYCGSRFRTVKCLIGLSAFYLTSSTFGDARYRLITLGTLFNENSGLSSSAYAINNRSEICGHAQDEDVRSRPTLWLRQGSPLINQTVDGVTLVFMANDLGTFLSENDGVGFALDLNDEAYVVGLCDAEHGAGTTPAGFLWTPIDLDGSGGTFGDGKNRLTFEDASLTAHGISEIDTNDDDHFIVVGGTSDDNGLPGPSGQFIGFTWDSDTNSLEVTPLNIGANTLLEHAVALDVNVRPTGNRIVVGHSQDGVSGPTPCTGLGREPIAWPGSPSDEELIPVGSDVTDLTLGEALAVNDAGNSVGMYRILMMIHASRLRASGNRMMIRRRLTCTICF